jgi:hypothetical protein
MPRTAPGFARLLALLFSLAALASACSFSGHRAETGSGGTGPGTGAGGSGSGGGGTGGPPIPGLMSIRVDPLTATVSVMPGAPAMQQFRAFGKLANGQEQDITDRVTWTVDRPLLVPMISGGLAKTTDTFGGVVEVRAQSGAMSGLAILTVKFSAVNAADGPGAMPALPVMPDQKFGGPADATRAPQLVYPNDGVLLPPNINGIEVHYRVGSAQNSLFEISFTNDATSVRVYTRCVTLEDGCVYRPSTPVWRQIAETNRGSARVIVAVQGTDDTGTAVGKSATAQIQFSKDDVKGGLYYWTTSQVDTQAGSPTTAIMRWDFASTTQTQAEPFIVPRLAGDGKTCVGCHAISHDGKKLVATLGGQNDGRIVLWDVAKKMQTVFIPDMPRSQFESWSPDGTQFVGMYTDKDATGKDLHTGPSNLILFDGVTAMKTGEIDLGGLRADHPDWSPDGDRIVFTSVDPVGTYTDQKPQKSGLAYVDRTAAGWGAPTTLLPAAPGKNRYYPAIAPTGKFMVFDESSCATGDTGADCDADTDPRAMLYGLPLPMVAGAAPVALAHANAPGVNDMGETALTNTYPKWSPFVFQLDEQRQVLWATFSSTRRYGLYKNNGKLFIWMVAVNPAGLGGGDPSYASFCLPFQDLTTSNHIAQWTTFIPIVQ